MSVPAWLFNIDNDGAETIRVQLRTDGEHVIIRIDGMRGEEIKIKACYMAEVMNECKTAPV